MARHESSTVSVAGQITTRRESVRAIEFHARSTNSGSSYVGHSTVSTSNGRELTPGEQVAYNYEPGAVFFDTFYVAFASGSNEVDVTVVLE